MPGKKKINQKDKKSKTFEPPTAPPAPPPLPSKSDDDPLVVDETTKIQSFGAFEIDPWEKYSKEFQNIYVQLHQFRTSISAMLVDLRRAGKVIQKEYRVNSRKGYRRRQTMSKRAPSGFAKPTMISNELCDFLGKPYGTEMARTEVTKYLTKYIKSNNLQAKNDKRYILPDGPLAELLKVKNEDEVTYFNLQKWMKPHFPTSTNFSQ